MKTSLTPRWMIEELGARVGRALAVGYDGPPNGRVREVPDERTIRYYTTLGLIDRPAEMRGRTALYGRRHLMQLVAIKRLQAKGLSLAQVQRQLVGLADTALARLADLPVEEESAAQSVPPRPHRAAATPLRVPQAFWKATPAPVPQPQESRAVEGPAALPLQGIRLGSDVTLLVAADRPLDNKDVEAIRRAARPLIERLETRRLIRPREEGKTQ